MFIKSPIEGYSGRSTFGPYRVEFVDGVAEVKETPAGGSLEGLRAYLESTGYTITDEAEAADEGGVYLPGDHTIPEVVEYAEQLTAEEVATLIEAEKAGKGRTTLLETLGKLEAAQAPAEAPTATDADADADKAEDEKKEGEK